MFPGSSLTNIQHDQHDQRTQFPSIIRTRSQQGGPIAPVDLYASPFKKAIRNHNHSTDQTRADLKTENIMQDITGNDTYGKTSFSPFSPSHRKRASSPSFIGNDNAGKRTRVLVQSSKVNSLSLGHSESLGTPHRDNPATPIRSSPGKGLIHMSFTKVPSSPSIPQTQSQSTPIRSLAKCLLFGEESPLTPLPTIPHPNGSTLSRKPSISSSISGQEFTPNAGPVIPSTPSGLLQYSPSKSRIPLPSGSSLSRLPRPSSSLSISTPLVAGPSSPIKAPPRSTLVKIKTRTNGRVKSSGIRSRTPLTRSAAKRGLRRTSSFTGPSSAGSNAPPPSSAEPSNAGVAGHVRCGTEKRSLVTSSLLSSENAPVQAGGATRLPASSSSGSPKKPTPLTALSTALQKLMATPPAAPLPRPRPNTGSEFARPSLTPSKGLAQPPLNSQDGVHVGTQTPGSSQNYVVLQKSKTLGHTQLNKTNTGVGKMGLPLRRPSTANINARPSPWVGAQFASKQTTLSTVPASPSRSVAPTEAETPKNAIAEILDVDAWVPSDCSDKGKEKVENATNKLEYLVPLADDPRAKEQRLLELVSPSRRASQASMLLTQSLSLPRGPTGRPSARSASASTAVQPIPRTPIKTRGRTRPPPPAPQPASDGGATTKQDDPMGGKRSNARMPGSLDVLKACVIFVDVRTEEGEDAAALFVDMLRGLGARILAKPGKSCTHLVYKAGLPSTITRYKLLPEPRPLPVSIGWVVECVEKRAHVDETRFLVNLNEVGVAGGVQRRRSMQPKQMRILTLGQLDNGEPANISMRADSSFTSEEPSTSGILSNLSPPARNPNDNLPPLERARQRSFRLPQE